MIKIIIKNRVKSIKQISMFMSINNAKSTFIPKGALYFIGDGMFLYPVTFTDASKAHCICVPNKTSPNAMAE